MVSFYQYSSLSILCILDFFLFLLWPFFDNMSPERRAIWLKKKKIMNEYDRSKGLTKVELSKRMGIPVSILKTNIYDCQKINDRVKACEVSTSKQLHVEEGKFPDHSFFARFSFSIVRQILQ